MILKKKLLNVLKFSSPGLIHNHLLQDIFKLVLIISALEVFAVSMVAVSG